MYVCMRREPRFQMQQICRIRVPTAALIIDARSDSDVLSLYAFALDLEKAKPCRSHASRRGRADSPWRPIVGNCRRRD